MSVKIGEAAARRHTAPIASMMLWAALCGAAVIVIHAVSILAGAHPTSYPTGIATLILFALAFIYPERKYKIWRSLGWLRVAARLPRPLPVQLLLLDRLETWRTIHITCGVFAMLPFWWHTAAGHPSVLEIALEVLVIVLVLSGFFGAIIEDFLPRRMVQLDNREVRLQDVEARFQALYVEAEELVLGHSEALVHAYLLYVRPLLTGAQPVWRLTWCTLSGRDPAPTACRSARMLANAFGPDAPVFNDLVSIAERKVRLEHNQFNLRLSTRWLRVHRRLAVVVVVLIIFHVAGVLYFAGL